MRWEGLAPKDWAEKAGLASVGGMKAGWAGLAGEVGGALTWSCRDFSVLLNFREPGGCMSSV